MSTSSAHASPSTPLMEVRGLYREFNSGDETVAILKNINLTVNAGEMVAIIGASGSGKSTLMNILGCLDKPTRGRYTVNGQETGDMLPDELAQLRREYFGFIFQRYHLLGDLTALGNAEIPAIYAGFTPAERHARTQKLLDRLGLGERMGHKPGQLSGGQQQRVSIARALVNGGEVILADEPTGALDSNSGREVMAILRELHAEGHTIIIVTHDAKVAENADRIIEISDGEIIADRPTASHALTTVPNPSTPMVDSTQKEAGNSTRPVKSNTLHSPWRAATERFREAFSMALRSMLAHRMRSFLTMLGIIIGIASVVSVVALGAGSQQQILKSISSMGTNTIDVYPGTGFGDRKAGRIRTLNSGDADVLAQQSYVNSVTPGVSTSVTVRYQNISVSAQVKGVGEQYFQVKGVTLAQGKAFDVQSTKSYAQEVVIDDNTKKALFLNGENPIGQVIVLGNMSSRIIGVAAKSENAFGGDDSLSIFAPYTTVMGRMLGQNYLKSITVRVSDSVSSQAAEEGVTKILTQRHGSKDFFISNSDSIRKTIEQTTQTMTLLVSMIAVISLIVGGIGVMNIMLVSVTERTQEIGVRMAVGARQSDILQQFLIEAVVICLLGGVLGIALSLLIGEVFSAFSKSFTMVYSMTSIVAAFACSTLIGVLFGFLPARNAARLDPVVALTRE